MTVPKRPERGTATRSGRTSLSGIWIVAAMAFIVPEAVADENGPARAAMSRIFAAFNAGKMISAGDEAVHDLLVASRASPPYMRVFALSAVHDLCIVSYQFNCEREVFNEMLAASKAAASLPPADQAQIASEMTEREVRRALVYGDVTTLNQWLPVLESAVQQVFGQDFARANLTIAEAHWLLGQTEKAQFFLRRGWYYFISNTSQLDATVVESLPEWIGLFVATGQVRRATTALAVARRLLVAWSGGPYNLLQLATVDIVVQNAVANPQGVAFASATALQLVDSIDLEPLVKDYLGVQLSGARLAGCTWTAQTDCDYGAIVAKGSALLRHFAERDAKFMGDPSLHTLATVLAFYSAANKSDVSPEVRSVLQSPRTSRFPQQDKGAWVTEAGNAFLLWHSDEPRAIAVIKKAAVDMLEEWRSLQAFSPLEASPLSFEGNLLIQACLTALVRDPEHLSEDDRGIVLVLVTQLHRQWRSVESQYAYAASMLEGTEAKVSLQAYYALELAVGREELEALTALVERVLRPHAPPGERHVDWDRFLRLNRLAELESTHQSALSEVRASYGRPEHLLTDVRQALRPGERFITHAMTFGRFVRVCFDRDRFLVRSIQTDAKRDLLAIKTLQAALTNPSAPSRAIDESFPFADALSISDLVLGEAADCVGDSEHLVFAPDPVFYSVSLHVLIDPSRRMELAALTLDNAPWLGTSRAISMVTDARQFIALRRQKRRNRAPFAFLGVGDPTLSTVQAKRQPAITSAQPTASGVSPVTFDGLEELPQTRKELERLALLFGPTSRVLVGDQASELNFRREELVNYNVISFATHGLLRQDLSGLPEPALVLTPRDPQAPLNDGLLTASEISGLPLDADLVILSACNSAHFDPGQYAEQAAGLSTAFLIAGARSTLASMWSVDSDATAQLMQWLGSELTRVPAEGPSRSLRNALRRFLEARDAKKFRHPRFWAAFAVFGDGGRDTDGPLPTRLALTAMGQNTSSPVWGELLQSIPMGEGRRLEAGYQDTGKYRLSGHLRMASHAKVEWSVTDERWSFVLPAAEPPQTDPVVLAWRIGEHDSLELELRTYRARGHVALIRPLDPLGDNRVGGIAPVNGSEFAVVTYIDNRERPGGNATIRVVDTSGKTKAVRRIDLGAELDVPTVSVQPSAVQMGVWLIVEGSVPPSRVAGPPFIMGGLRSCIPEKRTDLIYVKADLETTGEPIVMLDVSVTKIVPREQDDLAVVTKYDSCSWVEQATAAVAVMLPGRIVQTVPVSLKGADSEGRAVVPLPDRGWILVSSVKRQLGPWKKSSSAREQSDYRPEAYARDLDSNRQTGVLFARFTKEGTLVSSQMHLIPGEMWIGDAFAEPPLAIMVGARNYAQFKGQVLMQ